MSSTIIYFRRYESAGQKYNKRSQRSRTSRNVSLSTHSRHIRCAFCFSCSLFLLDKEHSELVAEVFERNGMTTEENLTEIRLPLDQGIVGYVATTGQMVNVKDAYKFALIVLNMVNVCFHCQTSTLLSSSGRTNGICDEKCSLLSDQR